MPTELPILLVPNVTAWRQWLAREASTSKGVWLTMAKKDFTTPTSLTYAEALDEALCYGWIDSQGKGNDERTRLQRFTPRTAKSIWSQRNVGHISRLENEGRMQARGLEEVARAKADGRWEAAYAGPASIQPSREFLAALAKMPEAQEVWEKLSSRNRFAICFQLGNLRTEKGREKRIAAFVEELARGQTPYPQKDIKESTKAPTSVKKRPVPGAEKSAIPPKKARTAVAESTHIAKGTRRSARLRG